MTDEELKKKLMERDRKFNEEKKWKFEEEYEDLKRKEAEAKEPKKTIGQKFASVKDSVHRLNAERSLKKEKKHQDREERREQIRKGAEVKVYGHELSAGERRQLGRAKDKRQEAKAAKRKKISEGLQKLGSNLEKYSPPAIESGFNYSHMEGMFGVSQSAIAKKPKRDYLKEMYSFETPTPQNNLGLGFDGFSTGKQDIANVRKRKPPADFSDWLMKPKTRKRTGNPWKDLGLM
jgi:hypothetical protein